MWILIQNLEKSMEKIPFNLICFFWLGCSVGYSVIRNVQKLHTYWKGSWNLQVCLRPFAREGFITGFAMVKSPSGREREYDLMKRRHQSAFIYAVIVSEKRSDCCWKKYRMLLLSKSGLDSANWRRSETGIVWNLGFHWGKREMSMNERNRIVDHRAAG